MARIIATLLLCAGAVSATGCGTLGNVSGPCKMYGGVQLDGTNVLEVCQEIGHPNEGGSLSTAHRTMILICGCADLPLSAVADTVTLPFTAPAALWQWVKESGSESQAPPGTFEQEPGSAKPPMGTDPAVN